MCVTGLMAGRQWGAGARALGRGPCYHSTPPPPPPAPLPGKFSPAARGPRLAAEAGVKAGGGAVGGDARLRVRDEQPEVVDAAAHAEAVLLLAVATAGLVVGDFGSDDNHRASTARDAAAGAVAAGEAGAANGLVVAD